MTMIPANRKSARALIRARRRFALLVPHPGAGLTVGTVMTPASKHIADRKQLNLNHIYRRPGLRELAKLPPARHSRRG